MLMFGQSQKASWFQKLISNMVVKKGISEGGLSVLNQSGIAVSKERLRILTITLMITLRRHHLLFSVQLHGDTPSYHAR